MIAGVLGILPFLGGMGSTFTVHSVNKSNKQVYVKHSLINGLDLIESTGPEPIDISLSMKFIRGYTQDPAISILAVETLMAAQTPMTLVIGDIPVGRGFSLTLFVIESVTSKMTSFSGGSLAVAEIDVKLLEYSNLSLGGLINTAVNFISSF